MRILKKINAVALVSLALAGCTKDQVKPTEKGPSVAEYQPLAVGNEWVYSPKGRQEEQTIRIVGQQDGFFVQDDPQHSKLRVDGFGVRDDKRYLLQGPLEKGHSWSSIVSVSSTERYEIADAGFNCSVPAGSFKDCVRVHGVNRIDAHKVLEIDWTYAPGVGIVRIASTAKDGDKVIPVMEVELKRFKLNNAPAPSAQSKG